MAWPPPTLPTNRTNTTVMSTTHPADHNAANLAINDLVARVGNPAWQVATGGGDALPAGLGTLSWPSVAGTAFTYDAPNKRFVCTLAGQYVLSARAWANHPSVADIRINIGPAGFVYIGFNVGGIGTVAAVQTLNVNDTVIVQMNNTGAATTAVAGSCRFEASRVKV